MRRNGSDPGHALSGEIAGEAAVATHEPSGSPRYKWVALSTVTLGTLMVFINQSITLISMPAIFRGIHLDPLTPSNTGYLLWLLLGFLVVLAVMVVTLGRIGDMFGRVRMFTLGFAVFTFFSILLSISWLQGSAAAIWLISLRIGQGFGGAMLFANSSAIVTDAFPPDQRGLGLGINNVAAISGSFIGLVVGGLLAPIKWELVFAVSIPFGLFGTVWAYFKLRDQSVRTRARIDWWGNLTFAAGLVLILVGITYGLLPYGGHTMGWTNPTVLAELFGGLALLVAFAVIETRVAHPMFRVNLFRIRAFAAGNVAALLASLSRGGLMFLLIIWLQGIWLPLHGYSFSETPLWAGIYLVPLTVGFLAAGPLSGILADRFGARPFATGGLLLMALTLILLQTLPVDFNYGVFLVLIFFNAVGAGMFIAPNQTGIMNSLPSDQRGAGAGMAATFNSSAQVLSIGIFFTLVILGLAASLPATLLHGLTAHGVPVATAEKVSHLPPVGSLFAAFLGYNPMATLLGSSLHHLPASTASYLTSRSYFPRLISGPFAQGLSKAFIFAAIACVIGALASLLRGGKYHYTTASVVVDATGTPEPARLPETAEAPVASQPGRERELAMGGEPTTGPEPAGMDEPAPGLDGRAADNGRADRAARTASQGTLRPSA
jgi:MFS family permease